MTSSAAASRLEHNPHDAGELGDDGVHTANEMEALQALYEMASAGTPMRLAEPATLREPEDAARDPGGGGLEEGPAGHAAHLQVAEAAVHHHERATVAPPTSGPRREAQQQQQQQQALGSASGSPQVRRTTPRRQPEKGLQAARDAGSPVVAAGVALAPAPVSVA